ncbi:MAG: hypothetical protein V2B18_07140 [Pseudomonadota bacterium]
MNQYIVSRVENCGNPERLSESKQTSVGAGTNPAPTLPWFRRAGFAANFKEHHYITAPADHGANLPKSDDAEGNTLVCLHIISNYVLR